jgi:hypothetical protein
MDLQIDLCDLRVLRGEFLGTEETNHRDRGERRAEEARDAEVISL